MNKLKTTLFVLGMFLVLTQTIRHLYVLTNYDRPSVLDKYENEAIDIEIQNSVSLDSLVSQFDKAYHDVIEFEEGKTEEELKEVNKYRDEPYVTKSKYKEAIIDWEGKEEQIYEVLVFWFCGLFLILLGSFLTYKKFEWIGIALIITGIVEMIWWSSPNLSALGSHAEFLKFLTTKLILSGSTLVLLLIMWLVYKKLRIKKAAN